MGYEKHQRETVEQDWSHAARMNDYRCTYGHSIEHCDREIYFRKRLCGFCYRALLSDEASAPTCK